MNTTRYITPHAAGEEDPARRVLIEIHLAEAMEVLNAIDYYCKNAPKHFDRSPHSHRLRDLIVEFRQAVGNADPEYAKQFFDPLPPKDSEQTVVVHEVHHHHYYEKPKRHFDMR